MTASTTTTTLTERYVHATVREVPEDRRSDLAEELRSTITDMVDARLDRGETPEQAERAALVELGDPSLLAARYSGARLTLLGPRLYLTWKRLVLQLLTWVPGLLAVVVAAVAVIDGGHSVGEIVVDAGGTAVGAAIQIVFWTTLVFVVLDRVVTDEPGAWTPDALPDGPAEREYSLCDTVGGIAWNLVVAAALVLQQLRSWVEGEDGDDVPVLDPALWSGWLPFLLAVIAALIGLELWKYHRGWSLGVVLATVATSVAFAAPVVWLTIQDRLLNPAFVDAVGLDAARLETLDVAIAVGTVLVASYEVGEAVVKGVLHRGRRA